MRVGIVGAEKLKFDTITEPAAKSLIYELLTPYEDILVSGGCHLGGIDIWAEEISKEIGCYDPRYIHLPRRLQWSGGFRERNLLIVRDSEIIHCIVVSEYPENFAGKRFKECYHCSIQDHVKSGGCWTAHKARERGKDAFWHVIYPDGSVLSRYG